MDYIIIILLFIQILINSLILYFKSYLNEKGKNLATKEDVEQITTKIEAIKTEFSFQNTIKIDRLNKNKDAIINYYLSYIKLSENLKFNLSSDKFIHQESYFSNYIENISKLYETFNNNYYILTLFELNDKEFLNYVYEFSNNLNKYYIELLFKYEELKVLQKIYHENSSNFTIDNKINLFDQRDKVIELIMNYITSNRDKINNDKQSIVFIINNKLDEIYTIK